MSRVTSGDLSRFRDKFSGLEQDALPVDVAPDLGGVTA